MYVCVFVCVFECVWWVGEVVVVVVVVCVSNMGYSDGDAHILVKVATCAVCDSYPRNCVNKRDTCG